MLPVYIFSLAFVNGQKDKTLPLEKSFVFLTKIFFAKGLYQFHSESISNRNNEMLFRWSWRRAFH